MSLLQGRTVEICASLNNQLAFVLGIRGTGNVAVLPAINIVNHIDTPGVNSFLFTCTEGAQELLMGLYFPGWCPQDSSHKCLGLFWVWSPWAVIISDLGLRNAQINKGGWISRVSVRVM